MKDLQRVRSNIWTRTVNLGDFEVRGVLICDDTHAVVWDTLSHPRDMQSCLPAIGDRRLTIIYSHADWDHIWGTGGLPWQGADIIGHAECLRRFSTDVPGTLKEMQASDPSRWDAVKLIKPTHTFEDTLQLNPGTINLSLRALPGHTPDSIVAFLPDEGILLTGDAVETPFPEVPENAPMAQWVKELECWRADARVQTVIPSHGKIGGREIIQQNIDYLKSKKEGQAWDSGF